MDIFPAIDLKDGLAVRLTKGLMDSAKIYSHEPWKLAKNFEEMGSSWLHVVDLNGAFAGEPKNLEQIKKIVKNTSLRVQVGGGIRDEETIKYYIKELGISRVILGSIALKNPSFVKKIAKKYPVAVGIDAIDGYVAVEGWDEKSNMKATDLAKEFANAGVRAIICTDVGKDGTLSGVNVEFTEQIARSSGLKTIASGGVRDMEDIKKLQASQIVSGVIVGKAFYEGSLDLKSAFKSLK
ncbi:MAG: 1-(5-phosphoribosyl)-5-[(5-phosphoribosylamino)methylideneamino]imidazole-4-carboxamide isomerase [Proteobacteria bacterium]|nr:MAG: 1-(5-phosphoribosyl)-5-[(5-phosphoribosylamino)methylideneamino]imidazole-4-carboxamide isomerase [Pseudomonadota bacterium]